MRLPNILYVMAFAFFVFGVWLVKAEEENGSKYYPKDTCSSEVVSDKPHVAANCPMIKCADTFPCIDQCTKDSDCEEELGNCCHYQTPCGNKCFTGQALPPSGWTK